MSPQRSRPLRKPSLDRRVLLDRRGPLGLRAPLVHRDRPDFALPRRVVIRPSVKFPVMRTNTYSMLTRLMRGEAWFITMTADYHSHPLVAADLHALVPGRRDLRYAMRKEPAFILRWLASSSQRGNRLV